MPPLSEPTYTLSVEGISLGTLIPTQAELKPHDHPLDSWAAQAMCDVLKEACNVFGERMLRYNIEIENATIPHAVAIAKASLSFAIRHHAVAEHIVRNFKLVRTDDHV